MNPPPITSIDDLDKAILLLFANVMAGVPKEKLDDLNDPVILNVAQARQVRDGLKDILESVNRRIEELSKEPPQPAPIETSQL